MPGDSYPAESEERLAREADPRPIVAQTVREIPWWIYAGGILLLAVSLFVMLEGRRSARTAPAVEPTRLERFAAPRSIAPLFVPPEPAPPPPPPPPPAPPPALATLVAPPPRAAPSAPRYTPLAPGPQQTLYLPPPAPVASQAAPRPASSSDAILVIDTTTGNAPAAAAPAGEAAAAATGGDGAVPTARARLLRNRGTTVPQGALISVVLETALDSTRPGPARAIVSRDVLGADGERVLIPRGSRLLGEYAADLAPGQNGALVMWTRLVRPDGATIAIGSPSADPLGRVGIRGRVNTHFLERFAGAVLQSALDIGVNLASRQGNSNVILALPGTGQGTSQPLFNTGNVQPTLRIRQGAAISVFVARDLDFAAVEAAR